MLFFLHGTKVKFLSLDKENLMGRKSKKYPKEGERKSMKQLTKHHNDFMKQRSANRRKEINNADIVFESLLEKALKKQ